ncbi:hypothetical protein [Rhizorhabdus phycosphaerae]|uniref:hypothetical protein n=1 Tax=Rhizorhabdus phycosphaerae TaxID=2711156 RepID=UPI0013EB9979|nr:hypothetical protein [Rhizorhabdus phycosphaerae]
MEEDDRWGIWVDVEGFSNLWSAGDLAARGLNQLMRLIFAIGRECYPREPERLFAHQTGDAFYIASSFHERNLDRCASIAIALMRGATEVECVSRAAISEGPLADYSGTRPREIQDACVQGGDQDVVSLGEGVMTLQSVMGQGLINAVTLDKIASNAACKGSLLLISTEIARRLSPGFVVRTLRAVPEVSAIDWVHSTSPLLNAIEAAIGAAPSSPADIEVRLRSYIARHGLKSSWSDPTLEYAGLPYGVHAIP